MAIVTLNKPSIGMPTAKDQAHTVMFARNTITYETDTDAQIFAVPAGTLVTDCWVNSKTHFDGTTPTLTIGTDTSATALFASSDVNLADTGASRANSTVSGSAGFPYNGLYFASYDTIDIALNPDSSSDGEAEVIVGYIPPPNTYPY